MTTTTHLTAPLTTVKDELDIAVEQGGLDAPVVDEAEVLAYVDDDEGGHLLRNLLLAGLVAGLVGLVVAALRRRR